MTYYGLSLNTGNLGGDFYVNFLISGVVEFPAYALCLLLLDRWGRKKCHCSSMLLGGIACLSTIFTISFGGKGAEQFHLYNEIQKVSGGSKNFEKGVGHPRNRKQF
jgi:OCT family organic cation transporter-like MFS transporter 4/5